jgi:tryptophan synthase alpha chain
MTRISETFARLKRDRTKGFIPFITAGDPDLTTTIELLCELSSVGSALIELGVPFSDPMADGPVIQRASDRALRHSFGMAEILEVAAEARKRIDTPIVLFSYLNPLLQYGLERLASDARTSGVDGLLVTDLVPEESDGLAADLRTNGLDLVLLVAPTSSDDRLRLIAEKASGFIYAVSRLGVTGARAELGSDAEQLVKRVRCYSTLPVAVGFGVSNAEQVLETWRFADAAVVGSAIVAEVERSAYAPDLVARVGEFSRSLIPGIN